MRIAVNFGNAAGLGSREVALLSLKALQEVAPGESFEVWGPREIELRGDIRLHSTEGLWQKSIAELLAIPLTLRLRPADCLFSLGDTSTPAVSLPHLLLVQQAFLAYDTSLLDFPLSPLFRQKLCLMELYFKTTLRTTQLITVQSEHMKERLSARWNLAPDKIVVVPSGVEQHSHGIQETGPSAEEPFVLYPAASYRHKNHVILAEVMRHLAVRRHEIRCVITAGSESVPHLTRAAERAGVLDRFDFIGSIPKGRVRSLMRSATALVLPSKLESFGLPCYEAMLEGCAVIAADRPYAREACGDAALYADADDAEEFARHVSTLLESEHSLNTQRALSRERGKVVARPWVETGADYYRILRDLAAGSVERHYSLRRGSRVR
jgi:glycosyltransferase involved in cell wall biosynthesis